MNYKIYISAYLEETNQILVSFSSDETEREAIDYQSLAFDLAPYGDDTPEEIIAKILKLAPTICSDIVVSESYKTDDAKASAMRELVGKSFEYKENPDYVEAHRARLPDEPVASEEI